MNIFRLIIIYFLSWGFVFTPITLAQDNLSSNDLNKIVNTFNEKKLDMAEALKLISTKNSSFAKDFESYQLSKKISKDLQLPLLIIDRDSIAFKINEKKVITKILENGDIQLNYNNKKKLISNKSNFESMALDIFELLNESKNISLMSFLIENAYSDDLMTRVYNESSIGMVIGMSIIVAIIGTLFVLQSPYIAYRLKETLDSTKIACEKLTGKVLGPNEERLILDSLEKIKTYENDCKYNLVGLKCDQEMSKIKTCMESLKSSFPNLNNSNRLNFKDKGPIEKELMSKPSNSTQK